MPQLKFFAVAIDPVFLQGVGLIAILAVLIALVLMVLLREGRNKVLEQMLAQADFGSPEQFRGRLIVERRSASRVRIHRPAR